MARQKNTLVLAHIALKIERNGVGAHEHQICIVLQLCCAAGHLGDVHFLRFLASQGRTILVSSHVLSEVEQTADDVVIIARGRLVHASSLPQLEALARPAVRITSPDAGALAALVDEQGWRPTTRFDSATTAVVYDRHPAEVGAAAFARGLELHELAPAGTSLEALFLQLTADQPPGAAPPSVSGPTAPEVAR